MMRMATAALLLAGLLADGGSPLLAQPMMGGYMHGRDAGMMRHRGGWGYADPVSYLAALKDDLGITPAQESAWKQYSDTVTGVAAQMQGVHRTMYEAMGSATWEERRDMMNRMFEARQQAFDTVHAAAGTLMAALDASQQARAATRLPGLGVPGAGMMGDHRGTPRAP
jgi:hypothetical protein